MYSSLFSLAALAIGVLAAPSSNHLETRAAADNTVYVTDANKYCMIMPRDAHTNIGDSEHPGGMKTYCSSAGRYDNSQIIMIVSSQTYTAAIQGGMKTYCSSAGRYDNSQGKLPDNFWSNIAFKSGTSSRGARYAQLTGCIRPETLSRLNPDDGGGQYDSSGGDGGQGNPQGSVYTTTMSSSSNLQRGVLASPDDGGGQYDSSGGDGGQGNPQGSVCLGYNHYVELVEPAERRACIKCCDNYNDCPLDKDTSGCPAVIPGNYFDCA
ncbi:unnamed protein product [Rhizoctonia solani]|uniref:Uncharacterized protein n=1 Tax=Rhizoctonia solani TaxID=456999 RepID=A0A8H3CUS7_9AGAM|nr:unnamed protein product [Rhizoctonia solani]